MRSLNIILIALTTFSGCNKKADTTKLNPADTAATHTMSNDSLTYLALGDSYTVGEAEPQAQVPAPSQLCILRMVPRQRDAPQPVPAG